jgi:copper resistance protein B
MTQYSKILSVAIFAAFLSLPSYVQAEDLYYGFQMEELEYRAGENGENLAVWNGDAFIGTDELKLRWEGNGEYDLESNFLGALTNQLSLQTPISDFWDIKGGIRLDSPNGTDRWYGVVGLMGLAPQWIEVDADLYLSEKGNVSTSLDIEYELLLTNYLILTPSAEIEASFSSDREIGIGSGVNSAEFGIRLSYDLWDRALSPYIGAVYERKFGETADIARDEGEDTSAWFVVIGTKLLF